MCFFVFDHGIKILKFGTVELADFLKFFLNIDMLECGQFIVQIGRYAFASGSNNSVPLLPIEVFRQWQFVHDEIILHLLIILIIVY